MSENVTGLVLGAQQRSDKHREPARRAPQEQLRRRARRGRFPFSSCFSPSFPYSSFSSLDGADSGVQEAEDGSLRRW
jgi:hypothetical protein